MPPLLQRTKIVATLGPASRSESVIRDMIMAGMSVARLNFSHGSYDDHAQSIECIRQISRELDTPITLMQDLQGPKIRVGQLPGGEIVLEAGKSAFIVPEAEVSQPGTIPIDYPYLADEAEPGMQVLLNDGLLELRVTKVTNRMVQCEVIAGGVLKSRKGVNLPDLELSLPSVTDKDRRDLGFGVSEGVDWVCLSFVRCREDIRTLKNLLAQHGAADMPVIAKIEKPQAIEHLDAIADESDGLMVARGDLGVEMQPEKVPLLQKQMIRLCNHKGIPVITATQMLESMIKSPRPTRAEASDVANAIIDGTDAVMLSGESAVGKFPVQAVEMMARIAQQVEPEVEFANLPPAQTDETHAISEALNTIDKILDLRCIATFTTTGYTARIASGERPKAPVIAFTPDPKVYHRLNLIWGVKPLPIEPPSEQLEAIITMMEADLLKRDLVVPGDRILILGGSPIQRARGTNFMKIHTVSGISA